MNVPLVTPYVMIMQSVQIHQAAINVPVLLVTLEVERHALTLMSVLVSRVMWMQRAVILMEVSPASAIVVL